MKIFSKWVGYMRIDPRTLVRALVADLELVIPFCLAVAVLIHYLWDWLMPALFGVKEITYLQALGLYVLVVIVTRAPKFPKL